MTVPLLDVQYIHLIRSAHAQGFNVRGTLVFRPADFTLAFQSPWNDKLLEDPKVPGPREAVPRI